MEQRENAGYIITQTIMIKDTEFVFGEHPTSGMFVTWKCNNGTDYYWGHYTENRYAALKDLCDRVSKEIELMANSREIPPLPNSNKNKERER